MQEGAGVRQIVEDELRAQRRAAARPRRPARARAAGVGAAAPSGGLRRHVHLAHGGRVRARGRHARRGAGRRARRRRARSRSPRATGRARTRVADAFVEFARGAARVVIVRWGLGGARPAALGARESSGRCSSRARASPSLDVPGRRRGSPACGGTLRSTSVAAARRRPTVPTRIVGASAAAARSTPPRRCPRRPGCRSSRCRRRTAGAEWTRLLRHARRGRGGAKTAAARARSTVAIVYEPELTLDLPRRRDGRHGAERARALRRGALRRATLRATRVRGRG